MNRKPTDATINGADGWMAEERITPTRCWDGTTTVNGQVFLDGSDSYWVTSAGQGDGNGCWCWPPRT